MLRKETLELILHDAIKMHEARCNEPGVEKKDIEQLVAELGGDKKDVHAVLRMALSIFFDGGDMPDKLLS